MKKFVSYLSKITRGGFYIILFLCISALGITGYVIHLARNTQKTVEENISASSMELPFPQSYGAVYEPPEEEPEIKSENVVKPEKSEPEKAEKPQTEKPEKPAPEPKKEPPKAEYTVAVSGTVSEPFSNGELIKSKTTDDWRVHSGVDIKADENTPVHAICGGTVESVESDTMLGNTVKIKHPDGIISVYANLADGVSVKAGDEIKGGSEIGKVGKSALCECLEEPHLHLEVIKNGENIDPLSLFPAGDE